jgi:hypothetical protein
VNNNPINRIDPLGLSWLDWVQGGISLAGYIPGVNIAAGALNAGISLARGNTSDAAMHALSMIPGEKIAVAAYKAGKLVVNAARTEKAFGDAAKAAELARSAKNAKELSEEAKRVANGSQAGATAGAQAAQDGASSGSANGQPRDEKGRFVGTGTSTEGDRHDRSTEYPHDY